jgi:uncharacterized membrane protein
MNKFKRFLITGLVVLVPFFFTAYVVVWSFTVLDGWIARFGVHIPGVGIAALLGLTLLTGLVVRNYLGRRLHFTAEWCINHLPVVSTVYATAKEVCQTLFAQDKTAFERAVVIEFPQKGQYTIGFVTGDAPESVRKAINVTTTPVKLVYVMQAFSPMAGFVLSVPEIALRDLDMSVEDAMKLVLTGGMVKGAVQIGTEPVDVGIEHQAAAHSLVGA